jgi:fatty acid desaturase
MPAIAFALLTQGGLAAALGAIVLGVHYPRTAYLSHDIAHEQWGPRKEKFAQFMFMLAEITQGFGPTWWVEKHELHHAFPNACKAGQDGELIPIDGDIDARPFIVWDKALADFNLNWKTETGRSIALMLARIQKFLFFPMLAIARFNWSWQSIDVAFRNGQRLEGGLCIAHWVLGLTLAGYLTPGAAWTGWVWFLVAQLIGGLILACVFVLSHTGMEVYDASDAEGFYDRQARSTRDTPTSAFFDWLAGGLNSQIEHHMFPTMARRNLARMREPTRQAMIECGYSYDSITNREAMQEVLRALKEASEAMVTTASARQALRAPGFMG